jgi:medium-chain acyl-[acyl-carrier-protein] hydrolase
MQADAAVRKFMFPLLRADFQVTEKYTRASAARLPCGVVALGGLQDVRYDAAQLEAWRACAPEGDFTVRWYQGGHK